MKKIIRLTESDLARIVKQVIMEQGGCETEWTTVKTHLGKKPDRTGLDVPQYVCNQKEPRSFVRGLVPTIDEVKLKCVYDKISEWCKSEGYIEK